MLLFFVVSCRLLKVKKSWEPWGAPAFDAMMPWFEATIRQNTPRASGSTWDPALELATLVELKHCWLKRLEYIFGMCVCFWLAIFSLFFYSLSNKELLAIDHTYRVFPRGREYLAVPQSSKSQRAKFGPCFPGEMSARGRSLAKGDWRWWTLLSQLSCKLGMEYGWRLQQVVLTAFLD